MSQIETCRKCGKELTGAIESTLSSVGIYVYVVQRETFECNWNLCKGCQRVLCKKCYAEQRSYCCDEGRIVTRERAQLRLLRKNPKGRWNTEAADEANCRICGRGLTGAIEPVLTKVGKHMFVVPHDTFDCNWSKCNGCRKVMCKRCIAEQQNLCCREGHIVDHKYARVALTYEKLGVTNEVFSGS